MKAHIMYDVEGTNNLTITGHHLSTQLWDSGKALIRARNRRGKTTRAVLLTKTHSIDIDKTPAWQSLRYAAAAATAVIAVAAAIRFARPATPATPPTDQP